MRRTYFSLLSGIIQNIVSLSLFLLFLVAAYCLYDSVIVLHSAASAHSERIFGQASSSGTGPIPDSVGWLTIPDTPVDYPVMQGEDNQTYLNRDPYGNYSLAGSIFLDAANSSDFSDRYSLIYGHHMEMGRMFGALDLFRSESYFEEHRDGMIQTAGRIFRIRFFALTEADADFRVLFSVDEADPDAICSYLRSNAIFYGSSDPSLPLVALSTCVGAGSSRRLLLIGTLKMDDEV